MEQYDVVVIGLGAMGAATLDQLARRGARVLGIERFGIPHELGSSGGDTRLIRKAYFEHPDYVPLLERAYANWEHLEARTGERVLFRTGTVYIGRPDGELIAGSIAAARTHRLAYDELSERDLQTHASVLRLPEGHHGVYEPDGGFVLASRSIRLFGEEALHHGAHVLTGVTVREWRRVGANLHVVTDAATYRAGRVIVTAGSWSADLLPGLPTALTVTRQAIFWLWPEESERFRLGNFPCWAAEIDGYAELFYGFPILPASFGGQLGFKVAHHAQGEVVAPGAMAPVQAAELEPVRRALANVFTVRLGPLLSMKACMYTWSPDHHFVIDRHPHDDRVIVACGFSGHGFKFASVVGEALADLALEQRTALPIGFLGLERFRRG